MQAKIATEGAAKPRWKKWLPCVLLMAVSWALVGRDPAARRGVQRAWNQPYASRFPERFGDQNAQFEFDAGQKLGRDRRVQIDVLTRQENLLYEASTQPGARSLAKQRALLRDIESEARALGDDPLVIALLLRARLTMLCTHRVWGPISNPNYPAAPPPVLLQMPESPRREWQGFLELARRGQKLDPQNSYLDWRVIYALLGLRRDDEARRELQLLARKSRYDEPTRALIPNRLALMRELYGSPLAPRDYHAANQILTGPTATSTSISASRSAFASAFATMRDPLRQSACWLMDGVIADRFAARHARALDTAQNLIEAGRIARLKGAMLGSNATGTSVEIIAINRAMPKAAPNSRFKATGYTSSLIALRGSPISLYPYAQSQKRGQLTRLISAEWPHFKEYLRIKQSIKSARTDGLLRSLLLTAAERQRSILLRIFPSITLLGVLFCTLSRRFRDASGERKGGAWIGWVLGVFLPIGALECDFFLYFRPVVAPLALSSPEFTRHLENRGFLASFPFWVWWGIALLLLGTAASSATAWQNRQIKPRQTLKAELQQLFAPPADGLTRFDFGPVLMLSARATGNILLVIAFFAPALDFEGVSRVTGLSATGLQTAAMGAALGIAFALLARGWHTRPRRRAALYLALRLISEALIGFLVASSLFYAALAFAISPHAQRFDEDSRRAIERGEVQVARADLGLGR